MKKFWKDTDSLYDIVKYEYTKIPLMTEEDIEEDLSTLLQKNLKNLGDWKQLPEKQKNKTPRGLFNLLEDISKTVKSTNFNEFYSTIPRLQILDLIFDNVIQKDLLGAFYKENVQIPLFKISNDKFVIDTSRLAFTKFEDGSSILDDWVPSEYKKTKIFIAATGFGKTHRWEYYSLTFFRLLSYGQKKFMILISCSASLDYEKNVDHSTNLLVEQITNLCKSENDMKLKTEKAKYITKIFILSRLIYLIKLLDDNLNCSPKLFLLSQMNGNSKSSMNIFLLLLNTNVDVDIFIKECSFILNKRNIKPVIAIDEAHYFELKFRDQFISFRNTKRGFLCPFKDVVNGLISQGVIDMAFYAGTSLSIRYSDVIISGTTDFEYVTDFPLLQKDWKENFVSRVGKLIKIDLDQVQMDERCYAGRIKLAFYGLKYIHEFKHLEAMPIVLQESYKKSMIEIREHINLKLESPPQKIFQILVDLVIMLKQNVITIRVEDETLSNADIIDIGIMSLHRVERSFWVGTLIEPLAISIIESIDWRKDFERYCSKDFQYFYDTIINYTIMSSEKGKAFEYFILKCMLNPKIQNIPLIELPFVKSSLTTNFLEKIPKDVGNQRFKCEDYCFTHNANEDLMIFQDKNQNKLYFPSNNMGPDGVINSENVVFTLGVKLSTHLLDDKNQEKNLKRTNLSGCYIDKYGRKSTPKVHSTVISAIKPKWKVRIMIEYPGPKYPIKSTVNKSDKTILIYIHQANLNLLLDDPKVQFLNNFYVVEPHTEKDGHDVEDESDFMDIE